YRTSRRIWFGVSVGWIGTRGAPYSSGRGPALHVLLVSSRPGSHRNRGSGEPLVPATVTPPDATTPVVVDARLPRARLLNRPHHVDERRSGHHDVGTAHAWPRRNPSKQARVRVEDHDVRAHMMPLVVRRWLLRVAKIAPPL